MLQYLIAILTFTGIYAFVALGLSVQWGLTGLINLGQVAFFAIGAYATALLTKSGIGFIPALFAAAGLGGGAGALVALVTPRLREDYLAIVTLGFSEFVRLIFLNEKWLAGGPDGIAGIARPFNSESGAGELSFVILVGGLVAAAVGFTLRVERFPFGRVLKAIREDETVVSAVGKSAYIFKLQSFAIGAMLAAIGGGLFASYLTYISPDMFGANVSIFVLAAVLIGRQGSALGTIAGITVVSVLLEGTRLLQGYVTIVSGVQLAALRLVALGAGLMLIVLWRYRKGPVSP